MASAPRASPVVVADHDRTGGLMRRMIFSIATLSAFAALTISASAQTTGGTPGFEIRSFAGAFVPTGDMRNDFKTATTVGAQVAHELYEHMHLLGSIAWTHGHNKFANLTDDRTFIWQYDAGVELNLDRERNNRNCLLGAT